MPIFDEMLSIPPFSLEKEEKGRLLTEALCSLTEYHRDNCKEYSNILKAIDFDINKVRHYSQLPFLPVSLFKTEELRSIDNKHVFKTMTSSGTTGQAVSKIFLDKETSLSQQKVLVKIVSSFLEKPRLPMLIIDCPSIIKNRLMFSARGAGILGFSIFGKDTTYALDDDMKLNERAVKDFLERHKGEQILLFGFTYMVWQHFYHRLLELPYSIELSNAVLIHGGGWKKLTSQAVSHDDFRNRLKEICGISRVHDYYGMVEQTGCIYVECEHGHLHASIFSDVIARRAEDFSECDFGEKGIIQVVSTIAGSYPGHSLITEDEGIILGEDDCPCGRKGKYFTILGRLKNAEIRGCSDTYAADK